MQTPEEQNNTGAQPTNQVPESQAGQPSPENTVENSAEQALAQLRDELAAAQDRALRFQAELENLRRRHAREQQELQKYAPLPLAKDLLTVRDNLHRAIEAAEKVDESSTLLEGVRMVASQLLSVFEQHQIQEIPAVGEPFNPDWHEAIATQPSTEYPAGTVIGLAQTGFVLHDRVIRPAMVMVSSGPPEST